MWGRGKSMRQKKKPVVVDPRDDVISTLKLKLRKLEMENRLLDRNRQELADTYEKLINETTGRYREQKLKRLKLEKGVRSLSGDVEVTIIKGRDLIAMDVGDSSDPYCKMTLVNENNEPISITNQTSVVQKNRLTPEWNEEFKDWHISVEDTWNLAKCKLFIEVWDKDRIGDDDYMGHFFISLSEFEEGKVYTKWYELQAKPGTVVTGELYVSVVWRSPIFEHFEEELTNEQMLY